MRAFCRRMLLFPCHPILTHCSMVVAAIHGCIQDLQPTSVALWQRKGPFHWAAHEILGVVSKKVRLEYSFGACNAHTRRNWTDVGSGGICNSTVDHSITLNGQFSTENKEPIRVVLRLQVALEGSRR